MKYSAPAFIAVALIGASTFAASAQMSPAPAMAPAMSSMPSVTVKILAQNGSGEAGTAVLTQDGDNVVVKATVTGAPATVPQPIHIHDGTCAKLDPAPKYPLVTMVDGVSTTTLKNIKLASLETGAYAINIHKSTTDIPAYVACGDIPKAKAM
jgi:hypothetical protein